MDVFISYSSEDRALVENVCKNFDEQGITYWVDHRDVKFGENFATTIPEAIEGAKIFLIFVSETANTSTYVLREVDKAVKEEKIIIPIIVGDVTLSPSMEFYLATYQFLLYSNSREFMEKLTGRIKEILMHAQPVAGECSRSVHFHGETYAPQKKPGANIFKVSVCVLLALILLAGAFLIGISMRDDEPEENGETSQSQEQTQTQTTTSQPTETSETTEPETSETQAETQQQTESQVAAITGEDQISDAYADEVEAFKTMDKGFADLNTHVIHVGEKYTPMAAAVWGNCQILSQNTAIAVAEGSAVMGVSVGETYIIIISSVGSKQVYKIIVTG